MRHPLIACFRTAWQGLRWLVTHEVNAGIHAVATLVVIGLGFGLRVSRTDWCWLVVAIALVWIAEALNTAIEQLADEISLENRERLGRAKDVGAGAVLVAAIAAVAIGTIVFFPRVRELLG